MHFTERNYDYKYGIGYKEKLISFIEESNRIEGITKTPTNLELSVYEHFLSLENIMISDVMYFVRKIANADLRNKIGMNVYVGNHHPLKGGQRVQKYLQELLSLINNNKINAYESHLEYEKLHPFMDGNGRSGRVIWAWQLLKENQDPFKLGFLHTFYYQTLDKNSK